MRNLPDEWDEACLRQVGKVMDNYLIYGERMNPNCINCPLARLVGKGVVFDYYRCSAVNKCIKEYPHIRDRKVFL